MACVFSRMFFANGMQEKYPKHNISDYISTPVPDGRK